MEQPGNTQEGHQEVARLQAELAAAIARHEAGQQPGAGQPGAGHRPTLAAKQPKKTFVQGRGKGGKGLGKGGAKRHRKVYINKFS